MNETKTTRMGSAFKALREIFIIVSSILLAFGLDAGWDLRQEENTVHLILSDLAVEFEGVVSDLQRYMDRNSQVIEGADSILNRIRTATGPVNVSAAHFGALLLTPTMNPRQRNLEALVASGRLDFVQPDSLRVLLAVWPPALEDVQENEIASWNFVHEVLLPESGSFVDLADPIQWRLDDLVGWRQEGYEGGVGAQGGEESIITITPTLEVVNLVQTRQYLARVANWNYRDLLVHAQEITQQLELLAQSE